MSTRLEPETVSRRDFIGLAGLGAAALALATTLGAMLRLIMPRVLPGPTSRFRIGSPAAFPPGTRRVIPERSVLIVSEVRGVAAMSLVCSHLGCIVAETQEGFACPCHGSIFGSVGEVVGGPAPTPLRWLAVSQAADGTLVVDAEREVGPNTLYRV